MEPIRLSMTGPAVEDVQDRLASLGYTIAEDERASCTFGNTTLAAVASFRAAQGLEPGVEVDTPTWLVLVDECYHMGDRTLYLRLPNFHGRDVRDLQNALNILGFSCGSTDGYYDTHTESAVKEFQESVGIVADGMAFEDTFDAIERLHHVWNGKPAQGPHPVGSIGFARAADVLEQNQISITAEDPISRNVAARIWNLASATSDGSRLGLAESARDKRDDDCAMIVISTSDREIRSRMHNVVLDGNADTFPQRIRTALRSSRAKVPTVRIEIPGQADHGGTFTTRDAQQLAVQLLDAICAAFTE